ncbi:pas [Drechmeria coniospora]|uniref:Pas n=1 Tax=Drechmeria coniospora TaxID=98403 RepID=A0A151GCS4_DRECN|nr:pas [Drechmeria coniospora]KYK54900.1 pas [Drechmeria coniospora]
MYSVRTTYSRNRTIEGGAGTTKLDMAYISAANLGSQLSARLPLTLPFDFTLLAKHQLAAKNRPSARAVPSSRRHVTFVQGDVSSRDACGVMSNDSPTINRWELQALDVNASPPLPPASTTSLPPRCVVAPSNRSPWRSEKGMKAGDGNERIADPRCRCQYQFPPNDPAEASEDPQRSSPRTKWQKLDDPIIYPGLYSATGFDIMKILMRVLSRPNPQVELGAVDCSVALILCDLERPDHPIVYASDSFCELTGYNLQEVLGRNCRFLQRPSASPSSSSLSSTESTDKAAIRSIRLAIDARQEIQLTLRNYKKNGKPFTNILSIIPLDLDSSGSRYAVGFQVETD